MWVEGRISGSKWCHFLKNTDRSTITRLGAEAEDDVSFMSSSYRLHAVFICFVPKTGKRIIILGVLMAMHGRQDSTTPDHGIERKLVDTLKRVLIFMVFLQPDGELSSYL